VVDVKASFALVVVGVVGHGVETWADTLPTVHLVANTPADTTLLPDSQFPSGTSFVVELAAPDVTLTATIEVWPVLEQANCKSPKPTAKQYFKFAMAASGDAAARVLRATIPPLQLDQQFCFLVTPSKGLSTTDIASWTTVVSAGYYADLESTDATKTALTNAITAQRDASPVAVGDFEGFKAQLLDELSRSVAPREYLVAKAANDAFKAGLNGANQRVQAADARARAVLKAANLTCSSPTIMINHELDSVLDLASADANIDPAVAVLKARNSSVDQFWIKRLAELKGKVDPARDQAIAALLADAAKAKSSPVPIQVTLDEVAYVTLSDLLAKGTPLDAIAPQVAAIAGVCHTDVAPLVDAVVAADKAIADLAKAVTDKSVAEAAKRTALDMAIGTAVTNAQSRLRIKTPLAHQSNGAWATAPVGTFISPDLGVAVAAPLAGGAKTPWLTPFFGINFYFAKVERDVAIKDLVGCTVRQLWSFSLGVSLTSPGIDGRTVDSIMLGAYPMVAVGRRLSEHARLSVGTFFYLLHREDPTNASRIFGVAPFVGLSVDTDAYHYIQKAYTDR